MKEFQLARYITLYGVLGANAEKLPNNKLFGRNKAILQCVYMKFTCVILTNLSFIARQSQFSGWLLTDDGFVDNLDTVLLTLIEDVVRRFLSILFI